MCPYLVFDQNKIILVGFYLYLNVHMFIDFTSHVLQIRCMFKNFNCFDFKFRYFNVNFSDLDYLKRASSMMENLMTEDRL